jgi:hypothetical protein
MLCDLQLIFLYYVRIFSSAIGSQMQSIKFYAGVGRVLDQVQGFPSNATLLYAVRLTCVNNLKVGVFASCCVY